MEWKYRIKVIYLRNSVDYNNIKPKCDLQKSNFYYFEAFLNEGSLDPWRSFKLENVYERHKPDFTR